MRAPVWILFCLLLGSLGAQGVVAETPDAADGGVVPAAEDAEPELVSVPVEMVNQSWFIDRVGTAVIHFAHVVEPPESLPYGLKGLSLIDLDVRPTPDSKQGKSAAIVRFVLRETGVVTFPTLDFAADGVVYRSVPQQILVGSAVRSEAMAVRLTPAKRRVYVGEPLRVDLSWTCDLQAGRLQALNYNPEFFNDPEVEVVIPRTTVPEQQQMGLPIGGRRVIAKRTLSKQTLPKGAAKALGTVELPIYLRLSQPGVYVLPASRLQCAHRLGKARSFGQYAAHFNNDLFAAENVEERYERLYAETEAIEIEVLPLPTAGRQEGFSGLFAPVDFKVAVTPTQVTVGELIQFEVQLCADAPHGMLAFPPLSRQRGLRGRFLIDDQLDRLWHAQGTTFRTRVRALSTDVQAFPALQVQVFDPETGAYVMRSTEPVALEVAPNEAGQDFMQLSAYAGTQVSLVQQPEGVWHNLEANVMNDLFNQFVMLLASWFWFGLFLGPLAFVVCLPYVRERRRRARDAQYRARVEAFAAFQRVPENHADKWPALLHFLAVSFGAAQRAWTVRDSRQALQSIGAAPEDIEALVALHAAADAHDFDPQRPPAARRDLNGIARRVLQLLGNSAVVLLLISLSLPSVVRGADWPQAEALFEQAGTAAAGSEAAAALYADAALKFQAVAASGERPGRAWYNAGNAWFKTGALGRSIAAYRQALVYRPWDPLLRDNLQAARALILNDVPPGNRLWLAWPARWLQASLVLLSLGFWALLLCWCRYRRRGVLYATLLLGLLAIGNLGLLLHAVHESGRAGVVIVDQVTARKGPAYAYAQAFNEPLYDGLEFTLLETRGDWGLIALPDQRQCWIVLSQAQLIQ
jgi:tetratricopeptide (TPR) repeat protein